MSGAPIRRGAQTMNVPIWLLDVHRRDGFQTMDGTVHARCDGCRWSGTFGTNHEAYLSHGDHIARVASAVERSEPVPYVDFDPA